MSYETRSRSDRLKAAILTGELNSVLDLINKPISREEKYLVALITGKIDNLPAPISQLDRYMYNTVTKVGRGELPKNRQDFYWYRICTGYVGEGLPIPHTTSDILDYDLAKNSAFREWDTFVGKYVEIVNSRSGSCKNVKIFGETIQDVIMGDKGLPRFAPYILNEKVENGRVYKTDTNDGEMQLQVAGKTYQNLLNGSIKKNIGHSTQSLARYKLNFLMKKQSYYTIIYTVTGELSKDNTYAIGQINQNFNKWAKTDLCRIQQNERGTYKKIIQPIDDIYYDELDHIGFWYNGSNRDNKAFVENIQILEGDWTNKPLPDYIDGIESVGSKEGKVIVESKGKNLFDVNKLTPTEYYQITNTGFRISNRYYTTIAPTDKLKTILKTNTKYRGSKKTILESGSFSNEVSGRICLYNGVTGATIVITNGNSNNDVDGSRVFETPSDFDGWSLIAYGSNTGVIEFANIQIEAVSSNTTPPTPYQPYIQPQVLEYPNLELRSLPNGVADTLDVDTGIVTRRVGKVVLNGSESKWEHEHVDGVDRWKTYVSNAKNTEVRNATISDKFVTEYKTSSNYRGMMFSFRERIFVYPHTSIYDLTVWLAWLKANPTTVYYELETPIIEKVPPKVLKTYRGGTIVENANNVKGDFNPTLGLKYDTIVTPGAKYKLMADKSDIIKYSIGGQNGSFGPEVDITPTSQTPLYLSGNGVKINRIAMTSNYGLPGYFPEGLESCGDVEKGVIELDVCNRNLISTDKYREYLMKYGTPTLEVINGRECVKNVNLVYHQKILPLDLPIDIYTISIEYKSDSNRETVIGFIYDDGTFTYGYGVKNNEFEVVRHHSMRKKIVGIMQSYSTSRTVWYVPNSISVVKKDDTIIPHESQQIKQQVVGALRKLPNGVCDEINFETGEYIQRVGKREFTGEESWVLNNEDTNTINFRIGVGDSKPGNSRGTNVYSNKFPNSILVTNDLEKVVMSPYTVSLCMFGIYKNKLKTNDVKGFKEWLKDNPTTVLYELAEPIITKIPKQMINSYQAGTNLKTTNKVKGTVEATVAIFQEGV